MLYGIGIAGPMTQLGLRARAAETAGFESCWVAETTHNAFVSAAAAIGSTSRIAVGCAVALAFPRSPTITAMGAWDLDELSEGRFVLGLGSQVKGVLERRFSVGFEHPAPRLREYVLAVRTIWAANRGEDVDFRGRFYEITLPSFHAEPQPGRRMPPVVVAAVGPGMCRMCGEVADGLVAHPLASPEYLARVVRPAIEQGAARAGRAPAQCPLTATVIASISDDVDLARREAKLQIAFYSTTRSYSAILALHGREAIVPQLRSAFAARDRARMISLIDDELCDAIAIAGPTDEAPARLRRWAGVADRVTLTGPWYGLAPGRMTENYAALTEIPGALSSPTGAES
jgi:probable F420-dependent oxidoreductase